MYKIYINETPLYLTSPAEAKLLGPASKNILMLHYAGKRKFLLNVIDQLEKSRRFDRAVVFSQDLEKLWSEFRATYKIIEAAGGIVFNEKNAVLAIFRREHWDLPKGKIDGGETPKLAAVREVKEETGLTKVKLGKHLLNTWHTYTQKKKRVLKKTYWYVMHTADTKLVPQTEEDIEKAVWAPLIEMADDPPGPIYGSITEVLQAAKNLTTSQKDRP